MEKKISPLEALKEIRDTRVNVSAYGFYDYDKYGDELCDIIETALKDYEKQKDYYAKLLESVLNGKELKALEIIKEKNVDIVYLRWECETLEQYNDYCPFEIEENEKLTKKEFDLLKEVLK